MLHIDHRTFQTFLNHLPGYLTCHISTCLQSKTA